MKFFYFFIFLFLFSFVSAGLDVGYDFEDTQRKVTLIIPEPTVSQNVSGPAANESDVWITNIGNLDDANSTQFENNDGTLSIIPSWLESFGNNLWCKLTGCDMTGNLNVDGDVDANTFTLDGTTINNWDDINDSPVDSNIYKIYFNHSMNNVITYNLTKSDASIITIYTVGGQKEIYGEDFR